MYKKKWLPKNLQSASDLTSITINLTRDQKVKLVAQYDEWCVKNGYFDRETKPPLYTWILYNKLCMKDTVYSINFTTIPDDAKSKVLGELIKFIIGLTNPKVTPGVACKYRSTARNILAKITEYIDDDKKGSNDESSV